MDLKNIALSDLIEQNYTFAAILHQFGIDFLDHLNKTLSEACKIEQVNIDKISYHIQLKSSETGHARDYSRMSLGGLTAYLKNTHHLYAQVMLPIIQHHIDRMACNCHRDYPQLLLLNNIFGIFKKDFLRHITYENNVVFPYINKLEVYTMNFHNNILLDLKENSIENFIMKHTHDDDEMLTIRKLTHNYKVEPEDTLPYKVLMAELRDFEADLKQHSRIEENVLLPKAEKVEKVIFNKIQDLIKTN